MMTRKTGSETGDSRRKPGTVFGFGTRLERGSRARSNYSPVRLRVDETLPVLWERERRRAVSLSSDSREMKMEGNGIGILDELVAVRKFTQGSVSICFENSSRAFDIHNLSTPSTLYIDVDELPANAVMSWPYELSSSSTLASVETLQANEFVFISSQQYRAIAQTINSASSHP
ncbi:hypothetical protein Ancab_012616 [Ancistrocladus abbreviatus]